MSACDGVAGKLVDIINFSLHSHIDYTSYVEKGNYAHSFGNIIKLTYTYSFKIVVPFDVKKSEGSRLLLVDIVSRVNGCSYVAPVSLSAKHLLILSTDEFVYIVCSSIWGRGELEGVSVQISS
jgi:hypothetical protein